MSQPEYMSCWSVAMGFDVEAAKQQSHDNLLVGAGTDRLGPVSWTFWRTDDAPILRAYAGDIELPPDVVALCRLYPHRTLVMATCEVKPL